MDFDEHLLKNNPSMDNLLLDNDDNRISIASLSSNYSEDVEYSTHVDYENLTISHLTWEALRHYKKWHYKNFYQSQIEEKVYEPGIYPSSERVMKMLAKLLHVGMEPDKTSTFYQPTVFNCSTKSPFLLELFSRTMWLLSKTRREMKASTLNDYQKVMNVLEKQLQLTLQGKPMNFKVLTELMIENNYDTVMKCWQKEKEKELDRVIATNPSVLDLKKRFIAENEKLIFEQRLNYLRKGAIFPKIKEKKFSGRFMVKLSANQRQLIIREYDALKKEVDREFDDVYSIANITHIVEGRACPHVVSNLVKDPALAFSLIFDNHEFMNFKATHRKEASYWTDAFYLLLEKDNRSEYFKNELNDLVKMDLQLHLLEIQNITIPKQPPPVPPMPVDYRSKSGEIPSNSWGMEKK